MARKSKRPTPDRIAELEDEVKQCDRRIADLKRDLDKERDLVVRLDEHLRDASETMDAWKQAFDMVQNEEGVWEWSRSFVEGDDWAEKYGALLKEWNRFVPEFNSMIALVDDRRLAGRLVKREPGRPLAANAEQRAKIFELHEEGTSLRDIAAETKLGLQTVRTLIGKITGTDRTSRKLSRIAHDRTHERQWRAKSQSRKALPKRIATWEKTAAELRKEVKGLK
jgi:Helix-turn-helix domain of resolvase